MIEILFRGKRIDTGAWVQGYYFKRWDEHYICWGTTNGEVNKLLVIPETVGQYSGLDDKNGEKIFEGDVMYNRSIIPQWDKELIDEIKAVVLIRNGMTRIEGWNTNGYIGEEINRGRYACLLLSSEIFEVIGNIHDNPELVEVTR